MLNGYNRSAVAPWSKQTELFAFAPAHKEVKVLALVLETFGFASGVLSLVNLFGRYIVLRDLQKTALTNFHLDLERTYRAGGAGNLRALNVVIARNDRVVTNEKLYPDPDFAPDSVLGRCTHSSVCKPNTGFQHPVSLLSSRL